jgi:hypothetical protein
LQRFYACLQRFYVRLQRFFYARLQRFYARLQRFYARLQRFFYFFIFLLRKSMLIYAATQLWTRGSYDFELKYAAELA